MTFCRRCGLPYGAAPRADAELPICPVCYVTVDEDGRLPSLSLPGLRVDMVHHRAEHDRHPVGDDDWLETLREGDRIRWGRWSAPFDVVRRYLVTGQVEAGRQRQIAHDAIVTAMTQLRRWGAGRRDLRRPARMGGRARRGDRAHGALRRPAKLTGRIGGLSAGGRRRGRT